MPKDTRTPQEILAHVTAARVALTSAIYRLSEAELTTVNPLQAAVPSGRADRRVFLGFSPCLSGFRPIKKNRSV